VPNLNLSKMTNTNHFVVTDRFGDVVSYTNTIEELGGSAIVVPGRGFLLNNELTDFDFTPLQAGVPDPNLSWRRACRPGAT
jgi:gamma-glutamyltranspeptidase / glutathione hydrolase